MKRLLLVGFLLVGMILNAAWSSETSEKEAGAAEPSNTIRIAAFNIQIFGKAKQQKADVMDILKKIAREFDVMLVQEIRDSSQTTAPFYLECINEMEGSDYAFVRSPRLGRTTSKEAYAYFYNTETVEFIESSAYVYDDTVEDAFEREPYIASFRSGNFDFTLAGIHTKPDDAKSEIGDLADVFESIMAKSPSEGDIIIMGDFNADGSYFDEDDTSSPFKSPKFHWVITNDMDTMTKTDWTYDRIVMTDATFKHEYVSNSAKVFYFDQKYGIDDQELIEDVSDHYPVCAEFVTDLVDDDGLEEAGVSEQTRVRNITWGEIRALHMKIAELQAQINSLKDRLDAVEQAIAAQSKTAIEEKPERKQLEDVTVYITRTGKKYHRAGCSYLRKSSIPIKKSEAIKQDYTQCSVCKP